MAELGIQLWSLCLNQYVSLTHSSYNLGVILGSAPSLFLQTVKSQPVPLGSVSSLSLRFILFLLTAIISPLNYHTVAQLIFLVLGLP